MLGLHLLCRDRLNLTRGAEPDTWESGFWDVPSTEATRLVGGMIYLHQTKGARSYFGGRVLASREVETESAHSKRIVFTFVFDASARDVSWRGADHGMAVTGGVVEEG